MISGFFLLILFALITLQTRFSQPVAVSLHDRVQQIFDIAMRAFNGRYCCGAHVKPVAFRACHDGGQRLFA